MLAYTLIAAAHAAINIDLEPYFADVDPETLTLAIAERALPAADGEVAAVVVVSPYGAPIDVAA
jgi:dTDP-4-amino-4,6-dideoxygalactose transaminase